MSLFPRIVEDATCPLPGYEGFTFRVLANPTAAEKIDWNPGSLLDTDCQECAQLNKSKAVEAQRRYCSSCQEARARMGQSCVAIFGESRVAGFDFATAEAALATLEQPELPDELLLWLLLLPPEIWRARQEDMQKKLPFSSRTGS